MRLNQSKTSEQQDDLRLRGEADPGATERPWFYPLGGMLVLFFVVLIRTAWMGDDGFIPARSMDNLVHGYGLRWNITERVQVFTEPLWFFVVTIFYVFTREAFITTIVLGIVTTSAAVLVMTRRVASSNAAAIAGMAILISSKAFIDYSTAGLENALSYLLVALFCVVLFRAGPAVKQLQWLILLASLSGFNRLDSVLMFAPAIAYTAWSLWKARASTLPRLITIAFVYSVPLWGWLLFSTIYFGFTFPNTYYAKMYTGVPQGELLVQGILYYFNSLNGDPVTLVTIGLAVAVGFSTRLPAMRASALGVILYLLYTVYVGGDFMAGRFFSVPLFFCVALLTHRTLPRTIWIGLAVFFLGVGLLGRKPIVFSGETYGQDLIWGTVAGSTDARNVTDRRGISDERGAFFQGGGLITSLTHSRFAPTIDWADLGRAARRRGRHMVAFQTPGFYGYYAGPDVYILDTYALCDPLLSKLPIANTRTWRVGHYRRALPAGYIRSIQTGENLIVDPKIRELYRVVKLLAEGPIWSIPRFVEIAKMNLGFYKGLIGSINVRSGGELPKAGTTYLWPGPPRQVEAGQPIFAEITGAHASESDATGSFWRCSKDVRLEFLVPAGAEMRAVAVPVQLYGRNVQLAFRANGEDVKAETLPLRNRADTWLKINGRWKAGRNVLEIIGSGEQTPPVPPETRGILFLLGQLRFTD